MKKIQKIQLCLSLHKHNIFSFFLNPKVRRGELVAVVGVVGAGKSSLLAAILGEMAALKGRVRVGAGGRRKAYVAQQAWIQNLTIRDSVPGPDPPDPHVFGPPRSTSQRYGSGSGSGSGSFCHAKIVRNLDSYYFVTLFDFLS
jgi:ABC-type Mn2+/Zn2+ transport system ATPase subunit